MDQDIKNYIDNKFQMLSDALYANIKASEGSNIAENVNKAISAGEDTKSRELVVKATNIITDKDHKFVTNDILEELGNKVGVVELDNAINDLSNNLKIQMNTMVDNILNSKNAIEAISRIRELTDNEDNADIISALSHLLNTNELREHEKSSSHISQKDRNVIDKLAKYIDYGYADWNASPDDFNYIRNKPYTMKASGGNADTVGGKKASDLLSKPIGLVVSNDVKEKESVDLVLPPNDNPNFYANSGKCYYFKSGPYTVKSFNMNDNSKVEGYGNDTMISCLGNVNILKDNAILRDIQFIDSNVYLEGTDTVIDNVTFYHCNITIKDISGWIITNCRFMKCDIQIEQPHCRYNVITNNILINTNDIPLLVDGNVVENNVVDK